MNTDKYNDAWTELLSARRRGIYKEVREAAEKLAIQARHLERESYVADGHFICNHTPDRNGVCTRCGYNPNTHQKTPPL